MSIKLDTPPPQKKPKVHKPRQTHNAQATPQACTFADLNLTPAIVKTLMSQGYTTPTPVQIAAIPLVKAGHDLIARAPTGTGKTAAFVLPALEMIAASTARIKPQVLILTPTRELAAQITDNIYKFGRSLRVNAISILGGVPYREQLRKLSQPTDILVATPGRLLDYLSRGNIDFSHIKILVLDEADRMLDMGFIDDVKEIALTTPKNRQTLLFTATLDSRLAKLAGNLLQSPELIDVDNKKITLDKITQQAYSTDDKEHKFRLLQHFFNAESIYKSIIFSATKRNADDLAESLRNEGYSASALHGDMRQTKRTKTITQFKSGRIQILVATDVAARGLHVDDVTHVFNYDLPKTAEDYVHRIGRTGRAGKAGIAVSFVTFADKINLRRIEQLMKLAIPMVTVPGLEPKKAFYTRSGASSSATYSYRQKEQKSGRRPANNYQRDNYPYANQRSARSERSDYRFNDAEQRGEQKRYTGNTGRSDNRVHYRRNHTDSQFKTPKPYFSHPKHRQHLGDRNRFQD